MQVANEALISLEDRQHFDLSLAMSMDEQGGSLHGPLDRPSTGSKAADHSHGQTKRPWLSHTRDSPSHHTASSSSLDPVSPACRTLLASVTM